MGMRKAEIAKGIVGIRQALKDNKKGWQIFLDGAHQYYLDETLDEIRIDHPDWHLIDIIGNGLWFNTQEW